MLKHGYAPIEQYYTSGKQGAWTDIYAICATLYYLLSGTIPPDSINRLAADEMKPLLTQNFRISRHVSDAVEKGLSVKAEERYQTMEALIEDLYEGMYVIETKKTPDPEPEESVRSRDAEEESLHETGSSQKFGRAGSIKAALAVIAVVLALALFFNFYYRFRYGLL